MPYLSDAQINEMAQAVVTAIDVAAITHTRKCEVAREYAEDNFGVTPRRSAVLLAVKLANVAWHGASMAARQNAPIYSHDPREEELMIEQNSRDDYYAELAAEHVDHYAHLEDWA